jgi:hypothetical protein
MALSRYVLTSTVTLSPDTLATATPGEPGTGGAAGYGSSASVSPATATKFGIWPLVFLVNTPVYLDPAGALYYALGGATNLRAWIDGTDNNGHQALSNLRRPAMATNVILMNAQTTVSTGFTGPGLATGVDDTEAQLLISQGYAALASSWEGGE